MAEHGSIFKSTPIGVKNYDVGDTVDVKCDHDRDGERVHDWLQGVVVQADEKMVAVQFLEDVYLTDGWMVPDHVLWYRQDSDVIKASQRRRKKTSR
ncbi:MAG: hypothetical protein JXA97_00480 [Anaerolineales bacterium]|nr:hypothetical protein [Anaerolineales bacterium]